MVGAQRLQNGSFAGYRLKTYHLWSTTPCVVSVKMRDEERDGKEGLVEPSSRLLGIAEGDQGALWP